MFTTLENGIGLEIVVWLQAHGNPVFDAVAVVLAFLGNATGYIVVLPWLYWCVNRTLGRRLLVVVTLALLLTTGLKAAGNRPRPFVVAPDRVNALVEPDGSGIPSGHVAVSLAVWGYIAWWTRRRWAYGAVTVYIIVMGWARMYAGVHYPQDVVAGVLVGALALGGVVLLMRVVPWWERQWWVYRAILIFNVSAIFLVMLWNEPGGLAAVGLLLGGGWGLLFEEKRAHFDAGGSRAERVLRYGVGLALVIVVLVSLDVAFEPLEPEAIWRVVRYSVGTFTIIGLYPLLMMRVGLADRDPDAAPSTAVIT